MKLVDRRRRFRPNEVKKEDAQQGLRGEFSVEAWKMCQERLSEFIRRYPQRAHDGGGTPRPRAHHGWDPAPECAAEVGGSFISVLIFAEARRSSA